MNLGDRGRRRSRLEACRRACRAGAAMGCSRPTSRNAAPCTSARSPRRSRTTARSAITWCGTISTTTRREGERAREEVGAAIVAAKTREFKSLGVVLGSHYENSPIIVADGTARAGRATHANFEPSARPGCLAPHAWLAGRLLALRSVRPRLQPAAARRLRRSPPPRDRRRRAGRARAAQGSRPAHAPASPNSTKRRSR